MSMNCDINQIICYIFFVSSRNLAKSKCYLCLFIVVLIKFLLTLLSVYVIHKIACTYLVYNSSFKNKTKSIYNSKKYFHWILLKYNQTIDLFLEKDT